MFLGEDLLQWLLLALGGALFAGNLMAVVRPPERQREEGHCGEPGCAGEDPRRMPQVALQIVQPGERSSIAMEVFGVRDAADRPSRSEPRRIRRHAPATVLVLEQCEMGSNFSREVILYGVMAEQSRNPQQQSAQRRHDQDSLRSSLSTSPASRRHRSACLSSARVPALVMA